MSFFYFLLFSFVPLSCGTLIIISQNLDFVNNFFYFLKKKVKALNKPSFVCADHLSNPIIAYSF